MSGDWDHLANALRERSTDIFSSFEHLIFNEEATDCLREILIILAFIVLIVIDRPLVVDALKFLSLVHNYSG